MKNIIARSETSTTGYHWNIEEIEIGVFWVAEYFEGKFNGSTEKVTSLEKVKEQFDYHRAECPVKYCQWTTKIET